MLQTIFLFLRRVNEKNPVMVCIGVTIIILGIDYISGRHVEFQIAYVIPVGIAAWQEEKILAYTLAFVLSFVRVGYHYMWEHSLDLYFSIFNATVNTLALFLYTYLINYLKTLIKKVKVLQGFLPICCYCKKIRSSDGTYVQIEQYITEHSQARFSHGVCEDCLKRYHPECYKDGKGLSA